MALGQQQQEELSICCRDVKQIFCAPAEGRAAFLHLSVSPSMLAPQGETLASAGSLWELHPGVAQIWALHPFGSHPQAEQSHSQAVSAAGAPQHPWALLVMERCNLCQLRMCPGLNLDKYLFTLRHKCRRDTSLLTPQSGLGSHMCIGT